MRRVISIVLPLPSVPVPATHACEDNLSTGISRSLSLALRRSAETLAVDDIPMNLKIVEQFRRFYSLCLCAGPSLPGPPSTPSLSLLGCAVTAPPTGWISFVIAIYALRARTMLTVIIFTTERILLGLRKLPNVSMTHCSISNEYKYGDDRDGERNQHHSRFSLSLSDAFFRLHFYGPFFRLFFLSLVGFSHSNFIE